MDGVDLTGATVLTVNPGDRLLLVLREPGHSMEDVQEIKDRLSAMFPSVEWFVATGVDEIVHAPA
jgi:hypothetical protein